MKVVLACVDWNELTLGLPWRMQGWRQWWKGAYKWENVIPKSPQRCLCDEKTKARQSWLWVFWTGFCKNAKDEILENECQGLVAVWWLQNLVMMISWWIKAAIRSCFWFWVLTANLKMQEGEIFLRVNEARFFCCVVGCNFGLMNGWSKQCKARFSSLWVFVLTASDKCWASKDE